MNGRDWRWYLLGVLWWGLDDRLMDGLRAAGAGPWQASAARWAFVLLWMGAGVALNAVLG